MAGTVVTTSWSDLWDQIDAVAVYTQKGIDHLEKFGVFLKERALIEDEYAAKLRALVKKNLGKKKEDEEEAKSFTYISSFHAILHELESLAGQHEVVAEQLRRNIHPAILHKCASLRAKRKNQLNELHTLNSSLNATIDTMVKTQKYYNKAFKDAEVAHIKYDKAEKNMDLSRAELERARSNATVRTQQCEEAKKNYGHALQTANNQQQLHYTELLPLALERLRQVDEERVVETRNFMLQSIEAETNVMPIMQRCYDDMSQAANVISPNGDSAAVVEQFRTGYSYPQPFPFEDLGSPAAILSNEGTSADTLKRPTKNGTAVRVHRKASMNIFKGNGHTKKDGTIDFNSYPPQQRCRRITREIERLEKEVEKNEQSAEGLRKMHQIYKENPKMGNAKDVEAELEIYKRKIDVLVPQIAKYKEMLSAAQTELNTPISAVGSETPRSITRPQSGMSTPSQVSPGQSIPIPPAPAFTPVHRASYSEESVSSSGSFGVTPPATNNSNGKKTGDSPIRAGAPLAEKAEVYEDFDELPILGTAKALYTFEGGSEGTMAITEGEEMALIEKDEGDGWTRVRHLATGKEGFVPTTYLECRWLK